MPTPQIDVWSDMIDSLSIMWPVIINCYLPLMILGITLNLLAKMFPAHEPDQVVLVEPEKETKQPAYNMGSVARAFLLVGTSGLGAMMVPIWLFAYMESVNDRGSGDIVFIMKIVFSIGAISALLSILRTTVRITRYTFNDRKSFLKSIEKTALNESSKWQEIVKYDRWQDGGRTIAFMGYGVALLFIVGLLYCIVYAWVLVILF